MPIYIKGKELEPKVDIIIEALLKGSEQLNLGTYKHIEDPQTVIIQTREAVFIKQGTLSPLRRDIKRVFSPGFSSCVLLFVKNIDTQESYTAHMDNDAYVNLTEISSLFESRNKFEIFMFCLSYEKVADTGEFTYTGQVDEKCEIKKLKIKGKTSEENTTILKKIITSVLEFTQNHNSCSVTLTLKRYAPKDLSVGKSIVLTLETGEAIIDESNDSNISKKYYPPVAKDNVLTGDSVHLSDFYIYQVHTKYDILSNKNVVVIYNNKTGYVLKKDITNSDSIIVKTLLKCKTLDKLIPHLVKLNKAFSKEDSLELNYIFELIKYILEVKDRIKGQTIISLNLASEENNLSANIIQEFCKLHADYATLIYKESTNSLRSKTQPQYSSYPRNFSLKPPALDIDIYELLEIIIKYTLDTDIIVPALDAAFLRAAFAGALEDVKFIADKVDINIADTKKSRTALHWAVQGRHKEIVSFLLSKGARKDILDENQKTALNLANDLADPNIIALFDTTNSLEERSNVHFRSVAPGKP